MERTEGARWGIVGGGMMGLVLAWRLAGRGHRVTLLEEAPAVGGLASAWRVGEVEWDRFYHVVLSSDAALLGLLGELGLGGELRWATTRTGFFVGGRLHEFTGAADYLRFPGLDLWEKFRLGLTIALGARLADPAGLEGRTAVEWLRAWSGPGVVDRFWRPLLRAKLGDFAEDASAAFIWATITRLHRARGRGTGPERFGTVRGGYGRILGALESGLAGRGVRVRTSAGVETVAGGEGAFEVRMRDGGVERFDRVILTLPPPLAARVCGGLSEGERRRLEAVEYLGIVCGSMVLSRPLSPYYVTNLADGAIPFTGLIEMTAVVDPAAFGGRGLLYFPRYATRGDVAWGWSDEEVRARALEALGRVHPGFDPGWVEGFRVARARQVMALPSLHYTRDRLPGIRTTVPGLYLVNSAQIRNGTLNVNATIEVAEAAMAEVGA